MDDLVRVACVEDDPDIRSIIELALVDLGGMEAVLFENGKAATAGMADVMPQLILMDVMMPEMDGMETLRHFRNMPGLSATPVIFMTAKAQPDEISVYKAAGAIDVIIKPFDPMTLADQLKTIWQREMAA